jgi:hypothetical protein
VAALVLAVVAVLAALVVARRRTTRPEPAATSPDRPAPTRSDGGSP